MMVRLNRVTAFLMLVLLAPILLPMKLYRWITGTGKKPVYLSTLEGDPLAYSGERPVVVSLWATWATVWTVTTAQIVQGLQGEFAGRCEFVYIEAVSSGIQEEYKADAIPAVLVFHRGQEVGRFINLLEAEPLRGCIAQRVA